MRTQAVRRLFDICPLAAGRAERVSPSAPTIRMTVPNSGLPFSPSALYRLSRFKPAYEDTFQFFREMNPNELAEAVNNQVSQQAYRFVFGCDNSQLRFVANRLGKRVWSSPIG
jgi:hypothetical protein